MDEPAQTYLPATSIAWRGRAALLLGPSGCGKSSTALTMIALGADLIADDQCEISREEDRLIVRCPEALIGKIEARNFGILKCSSLEQAQLVCAVDLSKPEHNRLPERREMEICGITLRLFHNPGIEALPFALLQYLKRTTIHDHT